MLDVADAGASEEQGIIGQRDNDERRRAAHEKRGEDHRPGKDEIPGMALDAGDEKSDRRNRERHASYVGISPSHPIHHDHRKEEEEP
jgi:hypothetical protein